MIKIESYLPVFTGFYNTIFESDEDNYIEEGKTYDDYNWDYADYANRLSMACVESIESELSSFGLKLTFQALISPKYYNYSNDSINVLYELEEDSMFLIKQYLIDNMDSFESYIEEKYTSCSGFISSYSNDYKKWLFVYLEDDDKLKHCFGSILNFILLNEGFDDMSLHDSVCDEMWVDGELIEN